MWYFWIHIWSIWYQFINMSLLYSAFNMLPLNESTLYVFCTIGHTMPYQYLVCIYTCIYLHGCVSWCKWAPRFTPWAFYACMRRCQWETARESCTNIFMVRISNNIHKMLLDVITRPCPNFIGSLAGLAKPSLKPGLVYPDIKVHGANMGPTWVLSAPDGPHVGPMILAIRVSNQILHKMMGCNDIPMPYSQIYLPC